jgi:DNA-binding HxlR family transcriptional regulator
MRSSEISLALFGGRWHVRTLALLHEHNGARFVVMKHRLNVSSDSLTRCLADLQQLGLVQRNPGYGHPLRPEYILTPTGRALAPGCRDFDACVMDLDVAGAVYRKWSVPSMLVMASGVQRFSDLKAELTVTPRALTQTLTRLGQAGLVTPSSTYTLTSSGDRVARLAADIPSPLSAG